MHSDRLLAEWQDVAKQYQSVEPLIPTFCTPDSVCAHILWEDGEN